MPLDDNLLLVDDEDWIDFVALTARCCCCCCGILSLAQLSRIGVVYERILLPNAVRPLFSTPRNALLKDHLHTSVFQRWLLVLIVG